MSVVKTAQLAFIGAERSMAGLMRITACVLALAAAPWHALEAQARAEGPSEKRLLAEFQESFGSSDPVERAEALTTLGEGSRALEDKGASKAVAKALGKGLEDEDLDVASAAVGQFGHGREVETTLAGLGAFLGELFADLERSAGKSSAEARERVERGSVLFVNGCRVLATYRDDRSAVILARRLVALPPLEDENDLAARLAGPLAACALDLGTLEVTRAAVKLTKVLTGPEQVSAARPLHDALAEFATRIGAAPPEWSENVASAWQAWLAAHEPGLPKKLGKLSTPPAEGPARALDGMPGKSG